MSTDADVIHKDCNRNSVCFPKQTRRWMEVQGFVGVDDERLAQWNMPLRWSPASFAVGTLLGIFFQSPIIFWSMIPFGYTAAIVGRHPFDYVLQWIRPRTDIPLYPLPRRFSMVFASTWLGLTGIAYLEGHETVGLVLAISVVIGSLTNALWAFCPAAWTLSILRRLESNFLYRMR